MTNAVPMSRMQAQMIARDIACFTIGNYPMPSKVRIISPKNSAEWDHLVTSLLGAGKLGQEQTYGGCTSEDRADHVRRKIRTAARKQDVASRVYWKPCPDKPGTCRFGPDCTHHVYITLYDIEQGRQYKAKQAEAARRG